MKQLNKENYHSDTSHISKSGMDVIEQSALHYHTRYIVGGNEQSAPKKHFAIGTAAHTFVLEPDLIDTDLAIIPEYAPKRPTIAQINSPKPSAIAQKSIEFWSWFESENKNRTHISAQDIEKVKRMADAVHKSPMCARILSNGLPEVIKTWTDPKSGAPVKCRADWDNENMGIIADLKTTDDASPKGFAKSCRKWTYDKQAAVYSDGMKRDNFVFMAVEKNAPYAVGVYFAGADMIEAGREKRDKNLNTYVEALSTGIWKGYSEDIVPVEW